MCMSLQKPIIELSHDPTILLWACTKGFYVLSERYRTFILIVPLFTTLRKYIHHTCQSIGDWIIKNVVYTFNGLLFSQKEK